MKRYRQTFDEISSALLPLEATWLDSHAESVILMLRNIPKRKYFGEEEIGALLDDNFDVAMTTIRLFLDVSKDEFTQKFRDLLPNGGIGRNRYCSDRASFLAALSKLGIADAIEFAMNRPRHWSDVLVERLKGGRGSAIKGQSRGRSMEDFVELILLSIFRKEQIESRCRFKGSTGIATAKTDFAIPSAMDPAILIEVKGYGATGSKQTDVIGDIVQIADNKRHDTVFLLVTDGITWKQRPSDLRKIVAFQNEGKIARIYTKSMAQELERDLQTLKAEMNLI